jgi:hypothetical protein
VAAWLLKMDYQAGENIEAGSSAIATSIESGNEIHRQHLSAGEFLRSRSRQEVLADVDKPVQR